MSGLFVLCFFFISAHASM